MSPFMQAGSPRLVGFVPSAEDVRAVVLDLHRVTPGQSRRLNGLACARCGGADDLRPGGTARTTSGPAGSGRLVWPVKVCRDHANTGGTW